MAFGVMTILNCDGGMSTFFGSKKSVTVKIVCETSSVVVAIVVWFDIVWFDTVCRVLVARCVADCNFEF